ncbi:MAG: hypothetical protein AMJ46_05035 [Latescibacteria bacterium DG_63]|nr:MAG: hypothetical protein AMJ46_05035 [Latescibacteria bacterium DG_63]
MKPRNALSLILALLLCALLFLGLSALLLSSGCEKAPPPSLLNRRPHVYVSGGPPQGGTSYYYVTVYWRGWDSDGVVECFRYAIDDTTEWVETRSSQETFLFTADSLRTGEEFGRWHTFWIKAVDNLGAESVPYYLTFDARTIAPRTTILSPRCDPEGPAICQGPLRLGTSVRITWEGEDPDCSDPMKRPVGYMWRLFNTTKYCNCPFGIEDPELLDLPDYVPDSTSFWSEPTADTEIQFNDLKPGAYWLFGVRAIDEAGAIEPHLRLNYNVISFETTPGFGSPVLRVYEDGSQHTFPNDGAVWEKKVPVDRQVCFSWEGDASSYGGAICGYTYGIDIENLDDPDQWEIGWTLDVTGVCLTFEETGSHYLYIKAKDCFGTEQLGTVELDVSEIFSRDVLFVDDYYDIITRDEDHDQFITGIMTRCYQYTDSVYVYNTFKPGPGGVPREVKQVQEPSLFELMRYRFIIWDTDASQNMFDTGIGRVVRNGDMQTYLKSGGRLWLFGREIVRGTAEDWEFFQYPMEPDPDSFAGRYLRISGEVDRPIVTPFAQGDGFRGADPNRALSELLPVLDIDYSKGGTSPDYGMSKVEAVMTAMEDPDLEQRPDTLFFYRANYHTSDYDDKACGFRFHDVYTGSKVLYLGFPIHYFYEEDAESLANFVIDWMFEE